jgi:GntR family transcriptional regulator
VLPFSVTIRPGRSIHDQLVFAVTRAIITGQLEAGAAFPSIRALSQELRINPNTAQKALTTLVERGLLEPRPGIGTVVASWRPAAGARRRADLADDLERLVIEAKRQGLGLGDVVDAVRKAWK